jgi:hypothetical protein
MMLPITRRATAWTSAVLSVGAVGAATVPSAAAPATATPAAPAAAAAAAPRAAADQMAATAARRWSTEQSGPLVHKLLRQVAADPGLKAAVASGRASAIQAAVNAKFRSVWYHWHVSRIRLLRGSTVLADAGLPFVVAPSTLPLHSANGRTPVTLEISDQDVIGFVRFMKRNHQVDVVARGTGAGHVETSLPAALHVTLPSRGTATIAGRRYQVREFTRHALNREPVRIWILLPA